MNSFKIDGVWYAMIASYSNSVYIVAENATTFTDMQEHWAKSITYIATTKGLVEGVGNSLYFPDKAVTRAEFTAILVRALGLSTSSGSTILYDDVKSDAWYYGSVAKAKELGLLGFVDHNSFMPDQPITREEMANMLSTVITLEKLQMTTEFVSLDNYKDINSVQETYLEDVRMMLKLKIITGTGADTFDPKGATTRA